MVEKKLDYSCSVHGFGTRGKNYPLTKAMVDHDYERIKAIDWREVGDEVNEEVLEGARALEGKRSDGQDCRMDQDLMCLTNCTPGNIFLDVGGEARPPIILQKEGNGAEVSTVAPLKGTVDGGDQVVAGWM